LPNCDNSFPSIEKQRLQKAGVLAVLKNLKWRTINLSCTRKYR